MAKKTIEGIIKETSLLLSEDRANTISQRDIVNQIAWLLFLKYLKHPEASACMRISTPYNLDSLEYHWDQWVPYVLGAKTIEEILHFLYNELQPHLAKVFGLKRDYMQINTNFDLFIRLLHLIYETEIVAAEEEDKIAALYSALFQLLTKENKAKGIFATPTAITNFMVEILNPQETDIIYDPACGTADLLIAALTHSCKKASPLTNKNIYGRDSAEQIVQLAQMNMILHGLDPTIIQQRNILDATDQNISKVTVFLTHPPLGNYTSPSPRHNKVELDCYEAWFLQHSLQMLTREYRARCGMIVSNVLLDGHTLINAKSKNTAQIRKELLEHWNVLMLIKLPQNIFADTNKQTYLLFFDNQPTTGKFLYYDLSKKRNNKPYTDIQPVQSQDFQEIQAAWKQWQVHLEDLDSTLEPETKDYQQIVTYEISSLDQRSTNIDPYSLLMLLLPPYQPSQDALAEPTELVKQLQENCIVLQRHTQRIQEHLYNFKEKGIE